MISKDEVMPMLLMACPSYRARWQDYCADSTYEPGLVYLDLGDFAHHIVDLLREGKTEEFRAVFDVIERMHLEGDEVCSRSGNDWCSRRSPEYRRESRSRSRSLPVVFGKDVEEAVEETQ